MKKNLLLLTISFFLFIAGAKAQCVANFSFNVDTSVNPVVVYFTDLSTGTGPFTYAWSFGDGTNDIQPNPVHTYSSSGTYYVYLQITDGVCTDSIYQLVNIPAFPVDISYFFNDSAQVYLCTSPDSVGYSWSGMVSGYLSTDSFKLELNFGDGSSYVNYQSCANPGFQGYNSHTYLNPGTYSPVLIVTGPDGFADTAYALTVYITNTCGPITGTVYQDVNGNCTYDAGDVLLPYISLEIYDGTTFMGWASSDSSGVYSFNVPVGPTYTINVNGGGYYGHFVASCPSSGSITGVTVPSTNNDFGLTCPTSFDLQGWFSGWGFRPGFIGSLCVYAYNQYCGTPSGQIEVIFSSNVTPLADSGGFGYTLTGNTVTLPISNPDLYWSFCIPVSVPQNAQIGDSVCVTLNITPTAGDTLPSNNTHSFCYAVRNSWDPNDKAVDPIGDGPQGAIHMNTDLTYTIRFQNTGTAEAINIFILDTLDASLDATSIEILAFSHPMTYTLLTGNILRFNFDNINLLDSNANEAASHGYVTYRIKQQSNVAHLTTINNSASIYFDFNPPIYTNKTVNTVDHFLSVKDLNNTASQFSVYPNPSKDNCTLYFKDVQKRSIIVTDAIGSIVYTNNFDGLSFQLNTSQFAEGSYIISIRDTKNQKSFGQMVVIR